MIIGVTDAELLLCGFELGLLDDPPEAPEDGSLRLNVTLGEVLCLETLPGRFRALPPHLQIPRGVTALQGLSLGSTLSPT